MPHLTPLFPNEGWARHRSTASARKPVIGKAEDGFPAVVPQSVLAETVAVKDRAPWKPDEVPVRVAGLEVVGDPRRSVTLDQPVPRVATLRSE